MLQLGFQSPLASFPDMGRNFGPWGKKDLFTKEGLACISRIILLVSLLNTQLGKAGGGGNNKRLVIMQRPQSVLFLSHSVSEEGLHGIILPTLESRCHGQTPT